MILTRLFAALGLTLMAAGGFALPAGAETGGPVNKTLFGGVAIDGYDATAYFDGGPAEGGRDLTHEWNGATWRFETAADRDAFAAAPESFAPQYGGHCANAMSLGKLVSADAEIWRIIDGKLYLFAAERGRERWNSDWQARIEEADTNWQDFVQE